jgi:preprotein translocase subunit SecD
MISDLLYFMTVIGIVTTLVVVIHVIGSFLEIFFPSLREPSEKYNPPSEYWRG